MSEIKAKDIVALLEARFSNTREYIMGIEVANGTGGQRTRNLDVVVVNAFESKGQYIEGIEIKISKADLRAELANPEKHEVFYPNLDFFSLACPADILDRALVEAIPSCWGIYVVKDGKLRVKRKPLALHDHMKTTIDRSFFTSLVRSTRFSSAIHDSESIRRAEWRKGYEEGSKNEARNLGYKIDPLEKKVANYEKLLGCISRYELNDEDIESLGLKYQAASKLDLDWAERSLKTASEECLQALNELASIKDRLGDSDE